VRRKNRTEVRGLRTERRYKRIFHSVLSPQSSVLFLSFLCGCRVEAPQQRALYTGPTYSLQEVIAHIDANTSQIPTLWARQDFDGTIVDQDHASHSLSAHGVILYRAPHELRIVANDDFGQEVFEIGLTDDLYWLKVVPKLDTLWWGRMRNVGKPSSVAIPIRPDLILDVLAVSGVDPNLNREPYPVLRFNNDADVYMIDSVVRASDRLLVQKEVWYDRVTLEPRTVLLFDANGRVVLRAHLSDFQPLADAGSAVIAMQYNLLFPDTGSTMKFTLSQAALGKNGIPRPGSIHLPNLDNPGVKNVIQIDKEYSK
jgi:hypothetical protein